jgi:hypothetical protein
MATNEPAVSDHTVSMGSERSLGIVFAIVFGLIGGVPWLFGRGLHLWALIIALAFLAAAFLAPRLLFPLNWLWFRLGLLLHYVTSPLIMAFLYYGAVMPMGLLLKALGKDLLNLKRSQEATSYWIIREPAGPEPGSMSKQF